MEKTTRQDRNISRVVSPGDKRKLNAVLWELRNTNSIKFFEEITGGIHIENKIGFSITLDGYRQVTFYFFTRKNGLGNFSLIETGSENSNCAQYFLGEQFPVHELTQTLKEYIRHHNEGLDMEHKLLKKVSNYLANDPKPHDAIKYVRMPNDQEDVEGVDLYVGVKEGEFPLQLKKSVTGQLAHMKKFPKIPSYVFNQQLEISEVLKLWAKIGVSYFKGQIEHK